MSTNDQQPSLRARLDTILADTGAVLRRTTSELQVEVTGAKVRICVVLANGRTEVAAGWRTVPVYRKGAIGKATCGVTFEGAVAAAMIPLARRASAEAEARRVEAAKALEAAEQAAQEARARVERFEAVVREDLRAAGETGEHYPDPVFDKP